jgi:hypothetical protein
MKALQQFCHTMAAVTVVLLSAMVGLRAEAPLSPVGAVARGSVLGSMQNGVTENSHAVDFHWTPNPKGGEAVGYAIYVWNDKLRDWYRLVSTRELSYRLTDNQLAMAGEDLYFHVTAFNDDGESLPEYKLHVSFRDQENEASVGRVIFTSAPSGKAWTGKRYVYDADAASEGVKDGIVYELSTSARRAMINPSSGLVVWTPPAQPGVYTFSVTARLAGRPEVQTIQTWSVQVYETQEPSSEQQFFFVTNPEKHSTLGEVYQYNVGVKYIGTGKVHFALDNAPAGVIIEPETGKLLWKPVREGDYTFTLKAIADEEFGTVEAIQEWALTVESAPKTEIFFVTIPVGNSVAGQEYRYDADVRYTGKGNVQYVLDKAPEGAIVDAETGVITWRPDKGGVYSFYLRATAENTLGADEIIQAWAVFVPVDNPAPGEIITGLTDPFQQPIHVTARPNPAVSELVVDFNGTAGTAQLYMYDVAGAKVLETPLHTVDGANTASLNVSALPVGQYFLHVESATGRQIVPVRIGR